MGEENQANSLIVDGRASEIELLIRNIYWSGFFTLHGSLERGRSRLAPARGVGLADAAIHALALLSDYA